MNTSDHQSLLLVHRGRVVNAIYREPEIPDYAGNPLLEALPRILTTDEAIERLGYYPLYDESLRKRPDHVRYHLIQAGLRFFEPMDIHVDLERRFSCLLRTGYVGRNPMKTCFWQDVEGRIDKLGAALDQYGSESDALYSTSAAGFNIVGISGIGKSQSILRILSLYPQVIHHSQYGEREFTHSQLVWLKLDCPSDGSLKGLCINFFQAIDSILGTNYQKNYSGKRKTADELLPDMAVIASNHFLGVLVIDEIQRLSLAKSGGAERMLNFFVQLVNTIGVPIVLVGTYKALPILSGDFSQMRRGTGQGDLIWDRMQPGEQWQLFIESLWRFQYTRRACSLEDAPALGETLYEETQGITDLAVKTYMFAQERAIDSGTEMVTPAIIRSVARDKLSIPRPVLEALKTGDRRALERYEDAYPTALKSRLPEMPDVPQVEGKVASAPDVKAAMKVLESASQAGEEREGQAVSSVEADRETGKGKSARGRHSKKTVSPSAKGELPGIIAALRNKSGLAAYDALRQADYIRQASEFLERS